MESLWCDLRDTVRALRRSPAFTVASLATLAVGMGATTAIVSVVNAALLEPPPYPEPHRIVVLGTWDVGPHDGQTLHYLRERARRVKMLAAYRATSSGWNLVAGDRAEYATGMRVTAGFFEVLGVPPLLGRGFSRAEDQANGPPAVVLSEPVWRRLLGGRRDAIGEIVLLGGIPHTVVGVMPAGFRTFPRADVWAPLRLDPNDTSYNNVILGRLAERVELSDADAELEALKPAMLRDLRGGSDARTAVMTWVPYQRFLGGQARRELLLLLGAVGVLLLIACVNTASLQMARAAARQREMATRSALGSGRLGLMRLALVESLVLALAGAALGLVVALWAIRGFSTLIPGALLEGVALDLDWRVLALTGTVAAASGVFFGLAPALALARLNPRAALRDSGRSTAGRSTMWLRRGFAILEVALALVLAVGAGLLVRTFVNLRAVDPGFDPSRVIVAKMSLDGSSQQTRGDLAGFFNRMLARVRAVPGVVAAAVGSTIPVERGLNLPLEPPAGGLISGIRSVDWCYVTPEYFEVFRIPLRAGRVFDASDRPGSAPVAVVNEAFVRAYFGDRPVVGQFLQLRRSLGDPPRRIVGVVADVKGVSGAGWGGGPVALASPAPPVLYIPASQVPAGIVELVHQFFPTSWVVRSEGTADVIPAIQEVVRAEEPLLPFIRFETMEQVIARDLETQRFLMWLLGAFAAIAIVLAVVGTYGVLAYATAQRTQEIGIRMALGATGGRVLGACLGEGLLLVGCGVALGLLGAAALSRTLSALVFGIEPIDPLTFAGMAAVLAAAAGAATFVPAWQASRLDPARVLRSE
jgi:predicted permease